MERYSLLRGTTERGEYDTLASSAGLPAFLASLKATDAAYTVTRVQQFISGFVALSGYESEPLYERPVTVRYAPMHLYKLNDMPPSILPFCSLCISGNENKGGRTTEYSQTFFFRREDMWKSDKFNYLDLLFCEFERNQQWLSFQTVADHRNKVKRIDPDAPPTKIELTEMTDPIVAIGCIEAIYNEKNVVIRLEKGCCFNRRAVQLLKQIYSMMQPRLATEIGFSIYESPKRIPQLLTSTSIRIFVVPESETVDTSASEKTIVIDLAAGIKQSLKPTLLALALDKWRKLPWSRRQLAMERVFADTTQYYLNPDVFTERTNAFFAELEEFNDWLNERDMPQASEISDLIKTHEQLQRFSHIPWAEEGFEKKYSNVLKGKEFPALVSNTLAECFFARGEEQKRLMNEYAFGKKYAAIDDIRICKQISRKQIDIDAAEKETELNALSERFEASIREKDHQAEQLRIKFLEERRQITEQTKLLQKRHNEELRLKNEQATKLQTALDYEQEEKNRAVESCKKMKAELDTATKERETALRAKRIAEEALAPTKHELTNVKDRLRKATEEINALKKNSGVNAAPAHSGLKNMVLKMAASFAVGAVLCGAIWITTAVIGREKEVEPIQTPVSISAEPEQAPPLEEPPIIEEPIVESPEETFDPDFDFGNWTDEQCRHQLMLAVPEIQTVLVSDIGAFCPQGLSENYEILAVFSIDQELQIPDAAEESDADPEPDDQLSTGEDPNDTQEEKIPASNTEQTFDPASEEALLTAASDNQEAESNENEADDLSENEEAPFDENTDIVDSDTQDNPDNQEGPDNQEDPDAQENPDVQENADNQEDANVQENSDERNSLIGIDQNACNFAVLLREKPDAVPSELSGLASMVLKRNEYVLLVYGNNVMFDAAQQAFPVILPKSYLQKET